MVMAVGVGGAKAQNVTDENAMVSWKTDKIAG
jgi:hypothetical protein